MSNLAVLREDRARLQHDLDAILAEAGPTVDLGRVTRIEGGVEEKLDHIVGLERQINAVSAEYEKLERVAAIGNLNRMRVERDSQPTTPLSFGPPDAGGSPLQGKSLRDFVASQPSYKAWCAGHTRSAEIVLPIRSFKEIALLDQTPQARRGATVDMALETRSVLSDIGESPISVAMAEYYEETGFTNSAAMVAEGATKPESDILWTLRQEPVGKAAHWVLMTREATQDIPNVMAAVRNRLRYGVERVEERQVINGNGTPPNIRGILQRSPQTESAATGTALDAIFRAIQKVRGSAGAGFAEPTFVWVHPQNWTPIQLATITGGAYLYQGGPEGSPANRVWGLPVHQTTEMPLGTLLVGTRQYADVLRREEVVVMLSTEHADNFITNKVTVLAESRFGLAVYRPSAFCAVTNLP